MEKFGQEGRKFWEQFGKSPELMPRHYFDYVSGEEYDKVLADCDLEGKKVLDLGAGYPPPAMESPEKKLSPLASELQEILENKGAEIIAIDVAQEPLKYQKETNRESVLGSAFHLPFKDGSIDGGVVALNLFNSSFKDASGGEVFMTKREMADILREIYRVLQEGSFVIVSNFGYITAKIDGVKILGPEAQEIIPDWYLTGFSLKVGFDKVREIPLDPKRIELGKKLIDDSFPEPIREKLECENEGFKAIIFEKPKIKRLLHLEELSTEEREEFSNLEKGIFSNYTLASLSALNMALQKGELSADLTLPYSKKMLLKYGTTKEELEKSKVFKIAYQAFRGFAKDIKAVGQEFYDPKAKIKRYKITGGENLENLRDKLKEIQITFLRF